MELRVWVDGTQRVVCGVKLTTTCQEIVFALAHATQQAGRFTMIERWRNNERLLSPNEQPLVTLQRWGEHMNEVEFILRKTTTDIQPSNLPVIQLQSSQPHSLQQKQQQQPSITNNNTLNRDNEPIQSVTNHNSTHTSPNQLYASHVTNLQSQSFNEPIYQTQQSQSQHQQQQYQSQQQQQQQQYSMGERQQPSSHLYSTIIKQPPAVPTKPRVNQITPVANHTSPHMGYYVPNQSPINMVQNHVRTRHPPSYLDYLETMTRSSLPSNSNLPQVNLYQRTFDNKVDMIHRNGSSPVTTRPLPLNNGYRYSVNGPLSATSFEHDLHSASPIDDLIMKLSRSNNLDTSLVINRSSSTNRTPLNISGEYTNGKENSDSTKANLDSNSNVTKVGHDMLKVIEEQKRVLLNQKNELDKFDKDQEYWNAKQNNEQIELINRVEAEIHQLEELWKGNQTQIKKLEHQDLEKELGELRADQVKIEIEVKKQKNRLTRCESDIALCKAKIEQLERDIASQVSDHGI